MSSLILSANIVAPMFLIMGAGLFLRYKNLLSDHTLNQINNLCFLLFLPTSLFRSIYNTDLARLNQPKYLLFAFGVQIVILTLLFLVIPLIIKENPARGSTAQAIFRTNFIMFGLVIAAELTSGSDLGVVSVLAALMIPLYNIGGVLILEKYRGGKVQLSQILCRIATNPFVISCVIGLSLLFFDIKLPLIIEKSVNDLAASATPVSLLALGAWFRPGSIKKYKKELAIGVLGRLMVVPAIFLPLCIWAGFREAELLGLTCMLIAPTAVATFNMAKQMDADGELACLLVVAQSAFSLFTMFFWIFVLDWLQLLP